VPICQLCVISQWDVALLLVQNQQDAAKKSGANAPLYYDVLQLNSL